MAIWRATPTIMAPGTQQKCNDIYLKEATDSRNEKGEWEGTNQITWI